MKRTAKQNRLLHKLLTDTVAIAYKDNLVLQFTGGRTSKSSEMSVDECTALIKKLQELSNQQRNEIKLDKLRKTVISLYRTIGYNKDGKADMKRIYTDVKNYWGKDLNEYTEQELIKIISVLKNKIVPYKLNSYE